MIIVPLLVLGVFLAGTAVFLVLRDLADDGRAGPADLREPLTFRQVAGTSPPPCRDGTVPDAEGAACFALGPEQMVIDRVESIEAVPPQPQTGRTAWAVRLDLTASDAAAFGRLTAEVARQPADSDGRRIAMIVGGRVISAPAVADGPVTGGQVMISGAFTRSEAEDLVERMTGR